MRQTKRTPTPPTAKERDGLARTYSYTLDGSLVSLTRTVFKELTIHRRDAVSAGRRERRRMAAILRDDRLQARINKAIQRQLDKVEKLAPPRKLRISVAPENRRQYKRKQRKIATKSITRLPSYGAPIIDRQGRRGIVMVVDYDGAKRHSFGIFGRRVVYLSNPEHCELDLSGQAIFMSNMGADIEEVLMAADLVELAQRESRQDAKVNVNIIIQLPHDVPQEVRVQILKAVAHELFGRHGLPYAAALHRPDPHGDQRNFHGHISGCWRPMTRAAPYGWDIAQDYRSDLDGQAYWRHARRRVAEIMTATLEREGKERRYTHLSNAERGLTHKPQKKLDKRKTRTAREGEFVADNEANRRVIEANVALEKRLKEKREAQRKRVLARKLAALAQVELAMFRKLEVRPVAPLEDTSSHLPVGAVLPSQNIEALPLNLVKAGRKTSPLVEAISPIGLVPPSACVDLHRVMPTTRKAHSAVLEGVKFASINVLVEAAKFERNVTAFNGILDAAVLPQSNPPRIKAILTKKLYEGFAAVEAHRDRSDDRARKIALEPVAVCTSDLSQLRPMGVEEERPALGLKAISHSHKPASAITKVSVKFGSMVPKLRLMACASLASGKLLSAMLKLVMAPQLSRETRPILRPVSRADRQPVLRPVGPSREDLLTNITPVSTVPSEGWLARSIAKVERPDIKPPVLLQPVVVATVPSFDPRLVQAMRAFEKRLDTVAHRRADLREPGKPENAPTAASEQQPVERGTGTAPSSNLRAFADAMRRKPSGLSLSDDGSVRPVAAFAGSWGVSKEALASEAAKRLLLPIYVEQELRFERLETELKFAGVSDSELADPDRKFAERLSADAAKTLEIYSRSQLLHQALHRVSREIALGENVKSRTSEMKDRGIDWRAIAAHTKERRKALRLAAKQVMSRQNSLR